MDTDSYIDINNDYCILTHDDTDIWNWLIIIGIG